MRRLLLGGVVPLWLGAGLADWYLHRRTRIEETAGPRESLIHHLTFAETGVPVLLGLFCAVNAGVLAAAYAAAGFTGPPPTGTRPMPRNDGGSPPPSSRCTASLRCPPVTAAFLLTALHWDQALELAGQDPSRPRFAIRLKRRDPLTPSTRAILLAAIALFGMLPYAEELWRCWRGAPTVKPLD